MDNDNGQPSSMPAVRDTKEVIGRADNTSPSPSPSPSPSYKLSTEDSRLSPSDFEQQVLDGMESYRPKPVRSKKLSQKEKNYVSWVEQYYHRNHGEFPTPEQAAFALRYTVIEIKYFMQNLTVQESMARRGINMEVLLTQHARTYLSTTQIATALTIANFADNRPFDMKLESLGVTPVEYFAWLKSPVYREFVGDMADQALDNVKPEAMAVFAQLIRDGNIRALQMYFQMTGALDGENETVKNLKVTLSRIIESVAKHVQDPLVLSRIATEISLIAPSTTDTKVAITSHSEEFRDPNLSHNLSFSDPITPSSENELHDSGLPVAGDGISRAHEPKATGIEEVTSNEFDGEDIKGLKTFS